MTSPIQIGNAPCSWGSLEFDGLQGDQIAYDRMLDELVETGYTGTELGDWEYMPTDSRRLHEELTQRSLTMLGAFVPMAFANPDAHADGERRALRVARLLAATSSVGDPDHRPYVVLSDDNGSDALRTQNAGRITPGLGLDDDGWNVFSRGVNRVANKVFDETGLRTVFHHHCAGFVETPEEVDILLSRTDPDLVGLVFDTGHYAFGAGDGADVTAGLARFSDRIPYIHFKDCSAEVARRARSEQWDYFTALRHGIFCELGDGRVDFPGIVDQLHARGFAGWIVVEQDVLPGMGAPKVSALRNRRYLASLGL